MKTPMPARQEPVRRSRDRQRSRAITLAAATLVTFGWHGIACAQPAGATVVQGQANFQQLGNSLLVTTSNAPGTKYSAIDWRSFSVPAGSITHFQQPGADSTSINRVTGGKLSDIQGTLSSNGNLVLVNPAGIALGKNAIVDTAGFTASTLEMSDADALAGRLRFGGGKDSKQIKVEGRIIARAGDVILIGSDVQVNGTPAKDDKGPKDDKGSKDGKGPKDDKGAKDAPADPLPSLQADNGSIIIAAGQQVEVTGRGLEGIVMQLAPKGKIEITKDARLRADAVGLFASQLKHSGVIQASRVVLQDDKVRLEGGDKEDKPGKGQSGNGQGSDNSGKGGGNAGNSGNGNDSGSGSSGSNSGNGNSGKGNSGSGSADSGSGGSSTPATPSVPTATLPSGTGAIDNAEGGGSVVLAPPPASSGDTGSTPTPAGTDPSLQAALAAPATQTVALSGAVLTTYTAPAVTPAQAINDNREQERYSAKPDKAEDKAAASKDILQCTR